MEKEFMLPEKWYVRATRENEKILRKWREGDHTGWNEGLVMLYSKMWESINKVDQCTEITFDQFKRYVLKEVPEDWNIEVNNPEQWCEVCTFLSNPENRSKYFIPNEYPLFIRRVGHRYGCEFNGSRNVHDDILYSIEKSITWEEFQQLKRQKQLSSKTTNTMNTTTEAVTTVQEPVKNQTITRAALKEIYDIACSAWKSKLTNIAAAQDQFSNTLVFTNNQIEDMFKAATSEQLPVVSKHFKRIPEDKNAFIKNSISPKDMRELSTRLFGDLQVLDLLDGLTPGEYPELNSRAFYVHSSYRVQTGATIGGGTYIAIYKK